MKIQTLLFIILKAMTVMMTRADVDFSRKSKGTVNSHNVDNGMVTTMSPYKTEAKLLMEALEVELAKRTKLLEKKLKRGEKDIKLVDSEGISGYRRVEEYVDEEPDTKDTKPVTTTMNGPLGVGDNEGYWRQLLNKRNNNVAPPSGVRGNQLGNRRAPLQPLTNPAPVGASLNQDGNQIGNVPGDGYVGQSKSNQQPFHPLVQPPSPPNTPSLHANTNQNKPTINTEQFHPLENGANLDGVPTQPLHRLPEGKTVYRRRSSGVPSQKSNQYPPRGIPKPFAYPSQSVAKPKGIPNKGYARQFSNNDILGPKESVRNPLTRHQQPASRVSPPQDHNLRPKHPFHGPLPRQQHPPRQGVPQERRFRADDSVPDFHTRPQHISPHVMPQEHGLRQEDDFHNSHMKMQLPSQHVGPPNHNFRPDNSVPDPQVEQRYPPQEVSSQARRFRLRDHFYDSHPRQQHISPHLVQQERSHRQADPFSDSYRRQQYLPDPKMAREEHAPLYGPMPFTHGLRHQFYKNPDHYEEVDFDKLDPNDFHVNFGPHDINTLVEYESHRRYEDNNLDSPYSTDHYYIHPEPHLEHVVMNRVVGYDENPYENNQYRKDPETKIVHRNPVNTEHHDPDIPVGHDDMHLKQQFTSVEYDGSWDESHEDQSRKYPKRRYTTRDYPTSSSSSESSEESVEEIQESSPRPEARQLPEAPAVPISVTVTKHVAVSKPALTKVRTEKTADGINNGTRRVCYECGWSTEKAEKYDGGHTVGWDRCRYAFHHTDAATFGIKPIQCVNNCYMKIDKDNHVHRGCYQGEQGVSPTKLGCHKQGADASVYCFCRGSKCNSANAPAFF